MAVPGAAANTAATAASGSSLVVERRTSAVVHGEACRLGEGGELGAVVEALDHGVGLGLHLVRGLLLLPARLHLGLDLLEGAVAGLGDAEHLEPDEAVEAELHRVVLDADVGLEGGRQHLVLAGEGGDLRALGVAAGAVDRVDGLDRQAELGADLGQGLAGGALVLDLVVAVEQVALGAVGGDLPPDLVGDLARTACSASGSILTTRTRTLPNRPWTGGLTAPSASEKAASATAGSRMPARVTVPRSMSAGFRPRSMAMSSKLVPAAILSAAALASSAVGNTICCRVRRSGAPKLSRWAS